MDTQTGYVVAAADRGRGQPGYVRQPGDAGTEEPARCGKFTSEHAFEMQNAPAITAGAFIALSEYSG